MAARKKFVPTAVEHKIDGVSHLKVEVKGHDPMWFVMANNIRYVQILEVPMIQGLEDAISESDPPEPPKPPKEEIKEIVKTEDEEGDSPPDSESEPE